MLSSPDAVGETGKLSLRQTLTLSGALSVAPPPPSASPTFMARALDQHCVYPGNFSAFHSSLNWHPLLCFLRTFCPFPLPLLSSTFLLTFSLFQKRILYGGHSFAPDAISDVKTRGERAKKKKENCWNTVSGARWENYATFLMLTKEFEKLFLVLFFLRFFAFLNPLFALWLGFLGFESRRAANLLVSVQLSFCLAFQCCLLTSW